MIKSAAHQSNILRYLDPVSWGAAIQLIGVGIAWAWVRVRRILRLQRLSGGDDGGEHGVGDALDKLTARSTAPRCVVVVEGPRDWPYLSSVIAELDPEFSECWIISRTPLANSVQVPEGWNYVANLNEVAWQAILTKIQADAILTTLTDLGESQFPKSASATYMFVFHSLVSPHVAYSPKAFSGFDVIFAPGERHKEEIVDLFSQQGISCPEVRVCGYPLLDHQDLVRSFSRSESLSALIAPSWTSDEGIASIWVKAVIALVDDGWIVKFRPHPETIKRSPGLLADLESAIGNPDKFSLDYSAQEGRTPASADLLITDWSGIALEWMACGNGHVLYVDMPQKIRNADGFASRPATIEADARGNAIVDPGSLDSFAPRARLQASSAPALVPNNVLSNIGKAGKIIGSIIASRIAR